MAILSQQHNNNKPDKNTHRGLPLFGRLMGILATTTEVFLGMRSSSLYSAQCDTTMHSTAQNNWYKNSYRTTKVINRCM